MAKLLFIIFILVVAASAQPDYSLKISDGNQTLDFNVENPSNILLGYWANDVNTEVTFEFESHLASEYSQLRPLKAICHPVGSNIWNFFVIKRNDEIHLKFFRSKEVTIDPYNRRYAVSNHWNFRVTIKSTIKTYWKFCANLYQCDLHMPLDVTGDSTSHSTNDSFPATTKLTSDSALDLTTIGFLLICCLLVTIVIGMAVYVIRGKRSSLNDSGSSMRTEAICKEVQLAGNVFRGKEKYEAINNICGAVLQKLV